MKNIGQLITGAIVVIVALEVAAGVLPKLLPTIAFVFGMVVIARVIWFLTRRDRW